MRARAFQRWPLAMRPPPSFRTESAQDSRFRKRFRRVGKKETHATRASFPKNRDKIGGGAVKICWIFRPFRGKCPEFIGEAIYFHIFRRSMAHRSDSKGTSPFAKREFPILHHPFSINLRNLSLSRKRARKRRIEKRRGVSTFPFDPVAKSRSRIRNSGIPRAVSSHEGDESRRKRGNTDPTREFPPF